MPAQKESESSATTASTLVAARPRMSHSEEGYAIFTIGDLGAEELAAKLFSELRLVRKYASEGLANDIVLCASPML